MMSWMVYPILLVSLFVNQDPHQGFHHGGSSPKTDYDGMYRDAVPLSDSPEGQALLNSCLDRYGGADRLTMLNSLRLVYKMEMSSGGHPLNMTKSFVRDRKHRVQIEGKERNETRILNGDEAWFENPDTVIAIDTNSGRYRAELFSYLTLALPLIEEEYFDGIRFGKRPDDPLSYIYLNRSGSILMAVGIDPKTHLITSSEGVVRQGEQNFVFVAHFSDHREHDGYTFPGKITHISMGLELGTSTIVKIEVNPELQDSAFRPRRF